MVRELGWSKRATSLSLSIFRTTFFRLPFLLTRLYAFYMYRYTIPLLIPHPPPPLVIARLINIGWRNSCTQKILWKGAKEDWHVRTIPDDTVFIGTDAHSCLRAIMTIAYVRYGFTTFLEKLRDIETFRVVNNNFRRFHIYESTMIHRLGASFGYCALECKIEIAVVNG